MGVDPATNHITDFGPEAYDANGNMKNDGRNTLTYDAENRVVSSGYQGATTGYAYDGAGFRVKKCTPDCNSPTSWTVYVFSGTKVIAEYENGAVVSSPTREYIYSGSILVATHESGALKFHYADHISIRVTSDSAGNNRVEQGHYPFGEIWYQGSGAVKWTFTTYERDSESLNDYAIFRTYINRLGRFDRPDPIAGSVTDPQSLNRYAYVLNDPCNLIDPLGLRCTMRIALGQELGGEAKAEIERIFDMAGVDVKFVRGSDPADFLVLQNVDLPDGVSGYAPEQGYTVLIDNAEFSFQAKIVGLTRRVSPTQEAKALGRLVTHEVGHKLGLDHSTVGIMRPGERARFDIFFDLNPSGSLFTEEQARAIRDRCDGARRRERRRGGGGDSSPGPFDFYYTALEYWGYSPAMNWGDYFGPIRTDFLFVSDFLDPPAKRRPPRVT